MDETGIPWGQVVASRLAALGQLSGTEIELTISILAIANRLKALASGKDAHNLDPTVDPGNPVTLGCESVFDLLRSRGISPKAAIAAIGLNRFPHLVRYFR